MNSVEIVIITGRKQEGRATVRKLALRPLTKKERIPENARLFLGKAGVTAFGKGRYFAAKDPTDESR